MSAAKKWHTSLRAVHAMRPEAFTTPPTDRDERKVHAHVTDDGLCQLKIAGFGRLDPDIAVQLAHWLLDTFEDKSVDEARPMR